MAKTNTENAPQLTSRQRLNERYRGINPELNVDDDEALGSAILGDLDAYDKDKERIDRFNKMVRESDAAPELLAGIMSGKNADGTPFTIEDYLVDNNIDFLIDYMEDPEGAKTRVDARRAERAANKEAEAKAAEEEAKAEEEKAKLIAAQDAILDEAVAEAGYKPEQVANLIDRIYNKETGILKRALNYELTKEDFLSLFKLLDYDVRMSEAEDRGYKRGRNEKIDMFRHNQKKRDEMPADLIGEVTAVRSSSITVVAVLQTCLLRRRRIRISPSLIA